MTTKTTRIDPPPGFRAPGDDPDVYGLVLAFDSDDPEFTRGFEAGMLWAALQSLGSGQTHATQVHDTNAVMVMRMAAASGCTYRLTDVPAEGWIAVEFAKAVAS